jgi:hypothetical protein
MTGFEAARRKMQKLFRPSSVRAFDGAFKPAADVPIVRLIDFPRRLPATPVEQRVLATLKKAGAVSLEKLVKNVAGELYTEELRKGAGVLDIGLFGGRLFNNDIVRELKAADGILWEIYQEQEIV